MENLLQKFNDAKSEFINSNAKEKSVENLYDIIYLINGINEKNFEEDFILAQIYDLVGKNIEANKIIEKRLICSTNVDEIVKLKNLQQKISEEDIWHIKKYRDLRDSKIVKRPTKLNLNDFIISKTEAEYCIEISSRIPNIVILNKNKKNLDIWRRGSYHIAFAQKEPTDFLLSKLSNHIEWIGQLKDELLDFYNNSFNGEVYDGKLNNVGQQWYDGLDIFDFAVYIDNDEDFETEIILLDYLQNEYGFRLEIENRTIKSIKYDAIL